MRADCHSYRYPKAKILRRKNLEILRPSCEMASPLDGHLEGGSLDKKSLCTVDCTESAINVLASCHFDSYRFPALPLKNYLNKRQA